MGTHIYNDYRLRNHIDGDGFRHNIKGPTLPLKPPTTISHRRGIQRDRKHANEIGQGLMQSGDDFNDQRVVYVYRKWFLMHRKASDGIWKGVFMPWKGFMH